jgi:hypothetical protein
LDRGKGKFAFGRGDKARPLRIYVDGETVPDSPEFEILLRFAHHPEIEVIGTDDRFPNRLTVEPCDPAAGRLDFSGFKLDFEGGKRWSSGIVLGAQTPELGRSYADPGAEERGARAMVMARGAAKYDSDAFVTTDPLLLERVPQNLVEGANLMSLREALAVLGLFLRSRQDFAVDLTDTYRYNYDRGLFYWVMVRDLTPAGWRWFSGCVANWTHTSDEGLLFAGQTVLERIERTLRARDRMHENLQLPDSIDAATEAVFYFDTALFQLGGAFDSLAKVAHVAHGLGAVGDRRVGWGRQDWMQKLSAANPALAQMMSGTHRHRDGRELVAVLRNSIHQEMLRLETWHKRGQRSERIVVPRDIETELEALVLRCGTLDDFGLTRETNGRLHLAPGVYLEAILPRAMEAMNAIMDATPVENLPGADPAKLLTGPPTDDRTFHPDIVERVRLLGGVG